MAEPYLLCPEAWDRTTLSPEKGGRFVIAAETGATPATTREEYWNGTIPWLTPKEVTDLDGTIYVSRTERTITEEGLKGSAKLMPVGTVMLTKRAPVGVVVINAVPMATNQGFLNFTCGSGLRPAFLAAWLKANRPYLDLVANGSTYPELYVADLFEFELSVPPLGYQDKVISLLNAFQTVIAMEGSLEQLITSPDQLWSVQDKSRKLRQLRDEMLPLIVSGQIDLGAVRLEGDPQYAR
ncbi:MAG: restriction endonuclease subunit S [Acidimicrobiia bacterium]|nr:restriction endonuclease subunit S [Acidimicrobiia bacterium]